MIAQGGFLYKEILKSCVTLAVTQLLSLIFIITYDIITL